MIELEPTSAKCEVKQEIDSIGKRNKILYYNDEDPLSVDLKWSIFLAASDHYKFDSLLKPFPKALCSEHGEKRINDLRAISQQLSNTGDLRNILNESLFSSQLVDLLHWVLFEGLTPTLRAIQKTDYANVLKEVPGLKSYCLPSHIFEVVHSSSVYRAKFTKAAEKFGVRIGFHGSRLENFFSILNYGLQVSMMKVGAFGPGIYLSSELGVSLHYSPRGLSWSGSQLGDYLSIVALCEIITHPSVRCHDDENEAKKTNSRFMILGGETGPVPNKYFIVQNSDMVRVRYLLVYGKKSPPKKPAATEDEAKSNSSILRLLFSYFFLLICIYLYRLLST